MPGASATADPERDAHSLSPRNTKLIACPALSPLTFGMVWQVCICGSPRARGEREFSVASASPARARFSSDLGHGRHRDSGRTRRGMATFLICHGAWSAGWAWKKVRPLLRAAGHEVFTPTYTGL